MGWAISISPTDGPSWLTGIAGIVTIERNCAGRLVVPRAGAPDIIKEKRKRRTMTIHHPHPRLLPSLAAIVALASILLAGCNLSNNGNAARDPNQKFVFPNTFYAHVLPDWKDAKQGSVAAETFESGLHLDPAYLTYTYAETVLAMLQVQLVSLDQNLNVVPDAADNWKVSPDGTTWTFHLRSNLYWSDGKPITPDDFLLGMKHALDPNLCTKPGPMTPPWTLAKTDYSCGAGSQFELPFLGAIKGAVDYANGNATSISGITVDDPDNTIKFQLVQTTPYFLQEMATPASMPIESSVFNQPGVGFNYVLQFVKGASQSGPWMVKDWFQQANPSNTNPEQADEIDFVPNPHWWGKQLQLKELDMPLKADREDFYHLYTQGNADFARVPASDYPFAQNLPDFHSVPYLSIDYFGMNFFDPPFDNLQVRQAFDLALNKQSLVDTVFQGSYTPTNHIIPQGIPGNNSGLLTPPGENGGTVALTGYQAEAQKLIQSVAQGCIHNTSSDWCPYIIGTGTNLVSFGQLGESNCPDFKVGATGSDTALVSTQKPIVVYAPSDVQDRVNTARSAAKQWSNVLCLDVSTSNDQPNTPEPGSILGALISNIAGNPGHSSTVSIWTLGYAVDYIDPQDFTSLQFDLGSPNNSENFGVPNPHSTPADTAEQHAIEAAMNQADIMPVDSTQHQQDRYAAYAKIEQRLVNEVAWLPYDQEQLLYRVRPYVMNFSLPSSGFISDQGWSDIYISAH